MVNFNVTRSKITLLLICGFTLIKASLARKGRNRGYRYRQPIKSYILNATA